MDIASIWLAKGLAASGHASISWSSDGVPSKAIQRVEEFIAKRVPDFVFGSLEGVRTIVLEDSNAFYLVKLWPGEVQKQATFLLAALQGKAYTQHEIQKLSVEISKRLDPNLDDKVIESSIKDTMIHAEPYDFLRPIKIDGAGESMLSEEETRLRVEEILPVVNMLKQSDSLPSKIKLAKFHLLLASKTRDPNEAERLISMVQARELATRLEIAQGSSTIMVGGNLFNLGLLSRHLGLLDVSSQFFSEATTQFASGGFARLATHARLNVFLNLKEGKRLRESPGIVEELEALVEHHEASSEGFTGIAYRHIAEAHQELGNNERARQAYLKALNCLEKNHYSADAASVHSALGVMAFKSGNYFEAAKSFSIAINILAVLKKEVVGLAKNLGISYLNLASEYVKASRILVIERDEERGLDLLIRGAGYALLAVYYLGSYSVETSADVIRSYFEEASKMAGIDEQLAGELKRMFTFLGTNPDENSLKEQAKIAYESLKAHQPLKSYYILVLYKNNGLAVFTRTSSTLNKLPSMDGDLIAGMISGISSFLGEVLSGDEVLSLIDRNDVKIMFEHTPHLTGIVFCNKDSPRLRHDLRAMLDTVEKSAGAAILSWDGDLRIFEPLDALSSAIIE